MNQEPMTLSDRLSDCLPKVGEPEAQFCVVDTADLRTALDGLAAVANARSQYVTALRLAREGYASEAATGLPVLPQWRERVMALIDDALKG